MRRLVLVTVTAVCAPLAIWFALPVLSSAAPSPQELQRKIDRSRAKIERSKGRERVLTADVSRYTRRISELQSDIVRLQRRQDVLEADLDERRAILVRIQEDLRSERMRLTRLRVRLRQGRTALEARLVELYKADRPDLLSIVLEAQGFADLMQRAEFLRRISAQDARVIEEVRAARAEARATAARLDRLVARESREAAVIASRRDEVASVKEQAAERRDGYREVRASKGAVLASVRADRRHTEAQLAELEAASRRIQARLASSAGPAAGPVRVGSSGLIWPVNGTLTSPFGSRWGRLHAGVDIGAPEGTPIRAAADGRVVIAGWVSGYGNYTCVQHAGSFSTCYAHQVRFGTSVGAHVKQGQVIGYVGNTGNSFGAHLHFETRNGGVPLNPLGYL